jgi:dephospho-CoA kinase
VLGLYLTMRRMPAQPSAAAGPPAPFRPAPPVVIGIVGGVASGKSAVAAAFAAHGLTLVDADAIAREVAAEPAVLAGIAAALGPELVTPGGLDRAAVAARVFREPAARARLEAILHPPIRARIDAALAAARAHGDSVLLDVPLLLENGLVDRCDHVVFVATSPATRRARAAARGWPAGELERREAAQTPLDVKRARAGFVVDNDGDLPTMARGVAAVLDRLRQPS